MEVQKSTADLLDSLASVKDISKHNWHQTLICTIELIQSCALLEHTDSDPQKHIIYWIERYLIAELNKQVKSGHDLPLNSRDIFMLTRNGIALPDKKHILASTHPVMFISPDNNTLQHMTVCKGYTVVDARLFSDAVFKAVRKWSISSQTSSRLKDEFLRYLMKLYPVKNFETQQIPSKQIEGQSSWASTTQPKQPRKTLEQSLTEGKSGLIVIISALLFALGIILGVIFMIFSS